MGCAFARLPRGCAFTAVLLIYSWKMALQCPSFAERRDQPMISFFFPFGLPSSFPLRSLFFPSKFLS